MKPVVWKGKEVVVEYDMFMLVIKGWMKDYNISKEKALDEFFEMDV